VDSGVITTLDNFSPACPPKILVFDLKTDTLVRNIILPREVSICSSHNTRSNNEFRELATVCLEVDRNLSMV
jgi:hypothetical protein